MRIILWQMVAFCIIYFINSALSSAESSYTYLMVSIGWVGSFLNSFMFYDPKTLVKIAACLLFIIPMLPIKMSIALLVTVGIITRLNILVYRWLNKSPEPKEAVL